ncbi:MAG: bicyclomycin resistance protein [Bacteriovorax sp.]|nr:bicyclomycin resistance protein [Rhizobacter sp.]
MTFLKSLVLALCVAATVPVAADAPAQKVLRYAFVVAETSLDPVKINDLYSRTLTPHIFEALYRYDHLARPIKIKPLTADGMPVHSDDFRVWTIKLKPGIYFADDPAFKGKKRELVAQDYVYMLKRFADPANRSPIWTGIESEKFVGLVALRQNALTTNKPFDYDRPIDGARALDRYTVQFRVEDPRPRFQESLAASDIFGAVAREVVEFYGDQADAHPVGTGPFRLVLAEWRRSSRIVFERSPDFREMFYDAEPAADDAEGQALLVRFKGRRLPMVDRVEISVIEEEQPRWLSFVNAEADYIERVGADFITTAMPGGKVAPNLAKRGIRAYRQLQPSSSSLFFNMENPLVGGYTPDKVALRRAVGLAMDIPREISVLRFGQAVLAQSPYIPYTTGFDPAFKSEMGDYDPARAKALLDLYGYVDRNGDGWRDMPDGTPLVLQIASQADKRSRAIDELTTKNMAAVGIKVKLKIAQWPENLKAARAGALMVWSVGSAADAPDGQGALARYDSRQIGGQNMARFKLPAFDAVYDQMQTISDGPQREALFQKAALLAIAYMPYKFRTSPIVTDMSYPWLIGFRRPVFWQEWWQYVDIDNSQRPAR